MGGDAKRRKEETKAREKADADFKEAIFLMRDAIKYYHKEWNFVWDRQVRAAELISDLPAAFARAGLVTSKLKNMTASNRRALAREVAGISSDHEYAFVLEPRLHESVLFDFLVKDPAIMELSFRTEVERKKARIRFDGDELADYAARCIENGERAQEIGQFKDANRFFDTAQQNIRGAADKYAQLRASETYADFEKRWAVACNDPDNMPTLTREKKEELQDALVAREKGDIWQDRNWLVRQGMDQPVKYCLGTLRVGVSYAAINKKTTWKHAPKGLHPDGDDTAKIVESLQQTLDQALENQKVDIEFKALAMCVVGELKDARAALLEAAQRDRDEGEARGEVVMSTVDEPPPVEKQPWEDLDENALGETCVTDEVKELHEAARTGNLRKLRWLLEECEKQHFIAVNMRYKEYKAVKEEPVNVNSIDHQKRTALFQCAKFNMLEAGRYLLDQGADHSHRDLNQVTPLHIACSAGASEMVSLLLERGAELEALEFDQQTPTHYCTRYSLGNMDSIRTLVGYGANLNAADKYGQTPLHQVIKNRRFGDKELYFLNFLCTMGADADARDKTNTTPLDMCDNMEARAVIKKAYSVQGDLRVERWGPGGLPPPIDGARPVAIQEQVMKITGGVPLVCVMHKGKHAYVNRDACRACALGIVVTVPYMDTSDFAHMCVSCSAKEITTSHIRSGRFV